MDSEVSPPKDGMNSQASDLSFVFLCQSVKWVSQLLRLLGKKGLSVAVQDGDKGRNEMMIQSRVILSSILWTGQTSCEQALAECDGAGDSICTSQTQSVVCGSDFQLLHCLIVGFQQLNLANQKNTRRISVHCCTDIQQPLGTHFFSHLLLADCAVSRNPKMAFLPYFSVWLLWFKTKTKTKPSVIFTRLGDSI